MFRIIQVFALLFLSIIFTNCQADRQSNGVSSLPFALQNVIQEDFYDIEHSSILKNEGGFEKRMLIAVGGGEGKANPASSPSTFSPNHQ
jgi:hypothetical protein